MSKHLVDTIRVRQERSQSVVETVSIASIFPPYSSDAESETSSASNGSSPRFSCSIDALFPPALSPSQSDGSENYEEIFPIHPFISTSSRRTYPMRQNVVLQVTMDGLSQWWFFRIMKGDHARKKAMRIAVGLSGVESATIKGQDKDQIEVKGEGIDTVKLATTLRKKVGHANIVSVGPPSCGLPPCTYYEIPRYDDTPSCSIM
nr:uncharacterized protein LOC111987172 [Quercus suber]POE83291.1 heavy metal-associated isoprenylated plant protein 16 [Quercus suber]